MSMPYDLTAPVFPSPAAQRARGMGMLAVQRRGPASVLADLAMSGSLKLLFPRSSGDALDAVLLNTAGGITDGDRFRVQADLQADTRLRVTTQAAERVYRAASGQPGTVETRMRLASGAALTWLPQETLLYDGAALDRRLRIEMDADARVLACECLVFGRTAMGERVRRLHLRDRIDLVIAGRTAFADRLRLEGDAAAQLARAGIAAGARAMASLLLAEPCAARRLDDLRARLPETAGVSALGDGIVFARLLAPDSFALRAHLVPILRAVTQTDLPRPWML